MSNGPLGAYDGGREESPATICRKIALAGNGDPIEVWGDGKQTRLYCNIDDCVQGMYRVMRSECSDPLNLGSDHLVTVDELVDVVAQIAGKRLRKRYDKTKPRGARPQLRHSRLRSVLDWEPSTSLEDGLRSRINGFESSWDGPGGWRPRPSRRSRL